MSLKLYAQALRMTARAAFAVKMINIQTRDELVKQSENPEAAIKEVQDDPGGAIALIEACDELAKMVCVMQGTAHKMLAARASSTITSAALAKDELVRKMLCAGVIAEIEAVFPEIAQEEQGGA